MLGQKRRIGHDSETATSARKLRKLSEDEVTHLVVDYGLSPTKMYDTVSYSPDPDFKIYDDDETTESGSRRSRRGNGKTCADPLHEMGDGSRVQFTSGFVMLQRDGDNYTCSCPVFHKAVDTTKTSCIHLQEYLGEDFEKWRISKTEGAIRNHINVNVLLAHKFEEDEVNPKRWWLSEKLDGVRAFWNGRCFYSRLGNAFHAPSWFTEDLPRDMTLDGELFGGRGQFQNTVKIVKAGPSDDWSKIRFHVFDSLSLAHEPFEKRMRSVIAMFKRKNPSHAVFVEQIRCNGLEHLNQLCDRVLSLGGEGIMLRQPNSIYENCRSRTLLKMKKFYDAEAVVIGYEKGKGCNAFRCGALRCRMESGKEFSVGSGLTNKDRNSPPKIGSIITYKFQELTKSGAPRFPSYIGVRIDMIAPKDAVLRKVLDE